MTTQNPPISDQITALEREIFEKKRALAKLRQALPKQGTVVQDYELENGNGKVKLSELFGNKNELMLVHNMGHLLSLLHTLGRWIQWCRAPPKQPHKICIGFSRQSRSPSRICRFQRVDIRHGKPPEQQF